MMSSSKTLHYLSQYISDTKAVAYYTSNVNIVYNTITSNYTSNLTYAPVYTYDTLYSYVNKTSNLFDSNIKIPYNEIVSVNEIAPNEDASTADYFYYSFTDTSINASNYITFSSNTVCDVLIVGGGGSGAIGLGGGSSGGLLYAKGVNIPAGQYPITVGIGGNNGNGGASSAFGATAKGGLQATTLTGATNNGVNDISNSIITTYDKNSTALAGGASQYTYQSEVAYAYNTVISATGTTAQQVSGNSNYYYYAFTTVGAGNSIVFSKNVTCDILVVGGGGGGGMNAGAGGGAGGLIFLENINISYGTYEITVGAGGQGGKTANVNTVAGNGNNSIFGSYIAIGGGGGGNSGGSNGNSGGSGGGAGNDGSGNRSGGAGTLGQGFKGGDGTIAGGAGRTGGGGGGAGGEGQASVSTSRAGDGGIGRNMSLTFGTSLGVDGWFAGGGGGGVHSGTGGTGGNGGGGSQNESGIANTGGGGGAGNGYNGVGKDGGSGIVIIRVPAIIQESGNITSNLASGGGGIGSSGETILVTSSQTQINGGSGFQVSIRKPYEFFAGGGGANGGKRVPMTGYTIGYGGNSSELSGENGGDGIIIVSVPISKDTGSVYNTNKIIDLPSASTSLSYGFLNNPSYYYYSFTDTTKTNYINFYKNTTCDVLIVGGGGSGAIGLGGGSSGGLLYSSNVIIPPGEYPITVGAGGKNANDGNGGASTAFGATVYGGMKATTIIGATKYLDNNITGSIISSAAINKTALGGGNSQNVGLVTYLYDQIITAVGATAQQVSGNISYYYYTFTSTTPGANSITFSKDITCDILLVGGGGAGNSGFGGGSAGAVIYYNNVPISSGTYQITVGNGGQTSGENGTSSTFYNAIAFGGRGAITIDGASSNIGSNVVFNNGTMVINEQAKLGGASYTILADPFFNDTANLLAWYKFDDNANDSSGNNKHLTLYNNPTPPYDSTITIDGSSVNIDGDTYLQNSTSGTYFTPSNLSISFWLYGGSQSTTHQAILSARKGSPQGGWIIYIPPSTNNISFWVGANPWNTLDVTVSDLFSTSWKFFTITYSSTNALKIYKNGVSIYSGTLSTSSRTADNFRIGAGANEQTPLFYLNNGSKIDDCRIYNKILSVDEISILYNRPKSVIISGGGGGTNSITGNGIQYTIGNIPNGGSPISLDITGTNINVAGGGGGSSTIDSSIVGLQQGTGTYGYGGNSRFDTFTPGGSGVVIIRTPTIIDVMDYSYQSISSFSYNEVVTAVGATPEQVSGNPDYYYYAFTDSTAVSKSITFSKDTVCDILIVGGGGGGGGSQGGGGGGAGGLVFYPNATLNGTVQIQVGAGGTGGGGGYNGAASAGENGGDSSITINGVAITAVGGGGGGQGSDPDGNNGGSGGGKRVNTSGTQSSSTQLTGDNKPWKGYGNRGGFNIGNNNVSGGGGGAGEEGYNNYGFQDTTSTLSSTTARNEFVGRGGDGLSEVVIDGTTYNFKQLFGNSLSSGEYVDNQLYFAGGGAGSESAGKTHICIGGLGGGADSAAGNDPGNHASPNTGGGGSGGNNGNFNGNNGVIGGNGGSGIVIIRVPAIIQDSVTLNVTTATGGGGIGSLGESITELTTPETPINGGAGFPVSIRAPNELFAGGGGANGGTRIPASGKIIGYGGNSSDTKAEDGGDGIVIIRFTAEIEEENPLKSINKITGSTTTILDDDLTPNKIVITDSDGKINTSNNITLTEFEYLSGVEYDIQQQFIDTSNYYDIMSSNINSNILATSNAIIDNFVNINTYLINTSNNLSSNLNSLNLENINVIASTRKVIVNNTYNDDLTINAKLTINSNLNISGTESEIFAPIFNTEALEINTLISLPNPILQVNYTGTSNILEIYSNISRKTVVSKEGYLGIGNATPQFGIDVSSNINISGNYKINGTNLSYYNMSNVPLTFNPSIHNHVISDIIDLQTQLNSKQDIISSISSTSDTITINSDVNLSSGNNYTINGVIINSSGEVVTQTTTQTSTQYINPIIEGTSAKIIAGTSYQYAEFTNTTGLNSIEFLQDTVCDILMVGGGGSGAIGLGGGSSGGMLYAINQLIPSGMYPITVGAGGVNGNGGDSVAFGATAKGGLQAITATGATNNGANIPGTTIAVWEQNKIALDGGIGIPFIEYTAVRKYPPTGLTGGTVLDKTIIQTPSGTPSYGFGNYHISWSTQRSGNDYLPKDLFDGSTGGVGGHWQSVGSEYSYGVYQGSNEINGYKGDWVKIQLPVSIYLSSVKMYLRYDNSRGPVDFKIFGSNDGTTWTEVINKVGATYTNKVFESDANDLVLNANNIAYSHYALVANKLNNTSNDSVLNFTELQFYGREELLVKYPRENMTSNTKIYTNGIQIKCRTSDYYTPETNDGWKAFDGTLFSTRWTTSGNYSSTGLLSSTRNNYYFNTDSSFYGEYLIIDLGEQITLTKYILYPLTNYPQRSPVDFRIYATNTSAAYDDSKNTNWVKIDERIGTTYTNNVGNVFIIDTVLNPYRYYAIIINKIGANATYSEVSEWELYGTSFTTSAGGGGVGSVGGSPTTSTDTPSGGDGFAVSIRTSNEIFAGGGGANGGLRVPATGYTIGYGGNSSDTTAENGGDGIVIIRWDTGYTPKIDSWKSLATTTLPIINSYNFYNETSNLLVWYKFDQEPSNNLTLTNYGIGNGTSSTYDGVVTMNGVTGSTLTQNNEYYPDTNNYNWSSTMDSENYISVNNAPQLLDTMMTSDYSISFWKTSYDVSVDYSVYARNDATIPATDDANSLVRIQTPSSDNIIYYDNGNFSGTTYNRLLSNNDYYNFLLPGLYQYKYTGYMTDNPNYFTGLTPIEKTITFNPNISIYSVINSYEWIGYFRAPTTGDYKFYTYSDDCSFVWIGDYAISGYTLVNAHADNRGTHGVKESTTINSVTLVSGIYYPIRIQFGGNAGNNVFSMFYKLNGGLNTVMTGNIFYNSLEYTNNDTVKYIGYKRHYTFTRQILDNNEILSTYINGRLLSSSTYSTPTVIGTTITPISGTSYVYASFTTVGSGNSIYFPQNTVCDVLIVGGGGGGGNYNAGYGTHEKGGGGAGAYEYISSIVFHGTYNVTIGNGGAVSTKGGDTKIIKDGTELYTCEGGGSGIGGSGGSGGGGNWNSAGGIANDPSKGNNGAAGTTNGGKNQGGGGGGAGSAGNLNNGGDGLPNSITGTLTHYAGGGGGNGNNGTAGTGGLGGGGRGSSSTLDALAGENGKGGGGGGGYYVGSKAGGTGGSGIVIIRWQVPLLLAKPVVSPDAKLYIGLNKNASFAFKNKSIGDFRIYNRVITTAEMGDLYNIARKTQFASIPKQINNYTSYYEFKTPVGQINTLTKYPRELMTANTLAYTDGTVVNVVASSFYPATENNAFNAFNGILDVNGWHTSDGKYTGGIGNVENVLGYKGEWLMIDLGEVIMIDSFKIYQRILAPLRMPKKFRFYASNDINAYNNVNHSSWKIIYEDTGAYLTSNTIRTCTIGSTKPYRYFFIVVNENYNDGWVQIAELEIYGFPVTSITTTQFPRRPMSGSTITYNFNGSDIIVTTKSSSIYQGTWTHSRVFDGVKSGNNQVWISATNPYLNGQYPSNGTYYAKSDYRGEYIMIDLGEQTIITQMKIWRNTVERSIPQRHPRNYRLYGSNNATDFTNEQSENWTEIFDKVDTTAGTTPANNPTDDNFSNILSYRYYALVINKVYATTGSEYVEIYELEMFSHNSSSVFKTNTITFTKDTVCDVLVVGGGGSGGVRSGGGGGAGACIYMQNYTFPSGTYNIVVGDGGASVGNSAAAVGNHGDDSYIQKDGIDIFRAIGGGGGGFDGTNDILPGGSSGGAAGSKTISENISTLNIPLSGYIYGNKGGIGLNNANTYYAGGGGGGAGNVGGNAVTHSSTTGYGGAGGEGRLINITGRELYYAAGGGGGIGPTGIGGQGGSGIGGNGSVLQETALNGLVNTGSGGGGSGFANGTNLNGISGAGGSGIVIIRWNNFADNSHINYNDVEVYNNNVVIGKTKYLDNFKQYGEIRKYPPIASTFTSTGGSFTELSSTITGQLYGNGTYVSSQSTILGGYSSVYLFDDVIGTDAGIHDASKFTSPAGNISSSGSILNNTNYIGEWIKFKIPSQIYLAYVKIYGRSNLLSRSPSFYRVYGSNDDINWTLLIDNNKEAIYNNLTDTNNSVLVHKTKIANLKQSDKFLYFALCINKIKGYGVYNDYLNFSELEFYGSETFTKVDMVSNYDFYTDTTDMKVWYKLEDLNDSSGNGLTLINSGATFDTTVGNYATGTGSIKLGTSAFAYVNSPSNNYFSGNTSFTYSFWLKSNNNSANNQIIVNSRNNTTQGWNVVRLQNETTIYFEVFKNAVGTITKKYEVGSSWNHFVCVLEYVSTTQQNMSIYMNGVFQEVKSGNIYDPYTQGALYFGKSAIGTAYPVADNTFIDDFRMYNRVLNFDEIQILYYRRKIQDRTVYSIYNDNTNLALRYDFDSTNVLSNKGYLGSSYDLTCIGTLQSEYGAVNLNNNSYLSINSALDTTGWTECSISFRLKRTALNTSWDVIFYQTFGQQFIIQRNNTTSLWTISIFGSGFITTTLNDFTADNIWNHYAFVFSKEGTQVRIKIYKNGNFDPVFTSLSGTWTTGINNIIMSYTVAANTLKGLLDDVRIYDRVLTTDEIQTLNEMAYNEVDKSDYIFNGSTDYVSNTSNNMIVSTGNIVTYTGDIVSESGKINTNNLFINQNLIINTSVRDYSSNILTKYPGNPLTSINSSVEKFTNPSINILAWYKFDGNLLDSSGNNRHLTGGTGTSFTSDCKLGNSCISFPNTAAQTVTSSTLSLAGNTSFTISLWTKRATAAKNDFMICAGTTAGTRTLLLISYTTTNYVQFACYNDDFKTVNTYADVNTWVHWTFVYNGTTRLRQIYRNGILENSSTASGVTNFAATFNIGNRTDALNGQFSGLIDDVRVFNRDLTPEEIATIYNINPTYNIYNTNKTRIGWDTGSIGLLTAGNGTYPHLPSISISYKKVIASGDIIISDGTATTAVTVNDKTITIPAGYQIWTVPITGSYKLVAGGARGMYLTINTEDGKGIVVSNMVSLTSGEKIIICVGKTPRTTSGSMYSGGGGTFISKLTGLGSDNLFTTLLNHTLLLVAGGGGGAGTASTNNIGTNGVITTSGTLPTGIGSGTVATNGGGGGGKGGAGGNATNGLQGSGTDGSGAGGGGFIGNGGNGTANTGGKSFLNGAQGGITPVTSDISTYAGFGGGGGSWNTGGGGGGYSGGNSHINSARNGGGGGGSYDINGSSFNATQYTNWDLKSISAPSQFLSGYSIDNGFVAIEQSSYASNPVSTTNYITGYPGEYLKLDMGEYILPKYIAMTPVTNDFYTNTSNLIAWYKFDGNLLDSSGNNKHLTLYNNPISVYDTIIYNSGISSINFDGDTYLEHLETNYFTSSGDITYSIWIYGGVAGTQQTIFSAREGNNKGIVLFIMADQKIGVYSGNSSWGWAGTYTTAAQVPNLSSNSWKHIVIIKKTDNTISIYYNNVALILNSNPGGVPQINSSTSLRIGGWGITDNAEYLSNGTKIDDFRIYNRALTVNEISILSNLNGSQLALMQAKAPKNFRLYGAQTINNAIIYHNGVLATPLQIPGSTDYYFAFTSTTGINSITFTKNVTCDVLVIGGGGGGGSRFGGGGGAGGVSYYVNQTFNGTYNITIGDGGAGGVTTGGGGTYGAGQGTNGNDSFIQKNSIDVFRGKGGGGGGRGDTANGSTGGSGGGAAGRFAGTGGTANQGSTYWNGSSYVVGGYDGGSYDGSGNFVGAGGGGAGGIGFNTQDSTQANRGKGGIGIQNSITGNNTYYAGGGGGGSDVNGTTQFLASGGLGGGGIGGGTSSFTLPTVGQANTGGGGGGGCVTSTVYNVNIAGAKGGSGIVIIRWRGTEEIQDYTLLLDNTTTSITTPSTSISYPIIATTAYRYFTLVVKDNWEDSLGTAISELEIYGYEQSPIYTKYPRQAMISNTFTYTDGSGITVSVTGSTTIGNQYDYSKSFDNIISLVGDGWASANTKYTPSTGLATTTYITGYAGEYMMIDLGEQITLNNIKIYPRTDNNYQYRTPKEFKIFASNSSTSYGTGNQNTGWTEIYTGSASGNGSQLTPYSYVIGSTTSYRYYMIVINKIFINGVSTLVQIVELELYGTPGNYVTSVSSSKWKVAPSTDANELEFSTSTDNGTNWITRSMISATATGGYTNFTGIHHCKASSNYLYDNKYIGRIVSTTKKYSSINSVYGDDNIKRNLDKKEWDCLPIVELSSKQNDKNVFGIITKIEDNHSKQREYQTGYMKHYYDKEEFDRRLHIAGVGEGGIWVCDYNTSNSNIESGDYITSSPILGFGMKQHDDLQHSYTVAKATMDCDFNPKLLPVKVIATSNILVETIDNTPTIFKNVIIDSLNNEVYTSNFDNDIKCMFELYNLNSSSNIQNNINVSNIQYDINIHNININNSSNTLCNINFYYGYLSNYIMINDNIDIYDVNSLKTADITSNSSNNIYYKIYLKDENDEYIYTDLLDDAGNIIYEYEYELQYIYDNGEYITKEEYDICISNNINVYKTAFIGCTYHCS